MSKGKCLDLKNAGVDLGFSQWPTLVDIFELVVHNGFRICSTSFTRDEFLTGLFHVKLISQ